MNRALNVLVVDDEEMILELFEDYLEARQGYSILTARNGAEALEICRNRNVDFCFTDLNMPGMDGIELTRQVLGLDATIPVVVMTGYPSADDAIATLRTGVTDFLVKPFRIEQIELTIQRALHRRDLFLENMLLKEELKGKERLTALNGQLSEKVNDLKILNFILRKMDWGTTSSGLFDAMVRLSAEVTGSDETRFYVTDDATGAPVLVTSFPSEDRRGHENATPAIEKILLEDTKDGIPVLIRSCRDAALKDTGIGSLIAMPLKIRERVFGTLAVMTDKASRRLGEKDLYYLDFLVQRAGYVIENFALYENIYQNLFSTLYAFVEAIEARDPYTKQHSSRVTDFAVAIGRAVGCSDQELGILQFSGHLHDIGKIGIRDDILLKPGRLTDEEREVIKTHPVIGSNIVGHLGLMSEEQKIIRHHHERWDGYGYPDGLKGRAIPMLSRILAVADVYDAMASDRAYRKRVPEDAIVRTIREGAGSQFDADIVQVFLELHKSHGITSTPPAHS